MPRDAIVESHWASLVVLVVKTRLPMQVRYERCRFNPCVGKIPWRMAQKPTPVSCLENPIDREAWQAAVHTVSQSEMTEAT